MQHSSFRVLELPQSEATPMPSTLARPARESKWSAGPQQGPYPRSMSSSRMIRGRSAGRKAWLEWSASAHERGSDRKSVKSSRSFTSKSSRSSQAAELAALGEFARFGEPNDGAVPTSTCHPPDASLGTSRDATHLTCHAESHMTRRVPCAAV